MTHTSPFTPDVVFNTVSIFPYVMSMSRAMLAALAIWLLYPQAGGSGHSGK